MPEAKNTPVDPKNATPKCCGESVSTPAPTPDSVNAQTPAAKATKPPTEAALDETIEESFPASDPPAHGLEQRGPRKPHKSDR